jgi:hypothetical protein
MWHVWETEEVHTAFWSRDPRERDHLVNLGVDGRIILKCVFKKWYGDAWAELIWLMIETYGGFM